jgi:hypothetical protein
MSLEPLTSTPPPPSPESLPPARVTVSAGAAFKAGFFGFFGAFAAALLVAAVLGCILAVSSQRLADWIATAF